MTVRRRLPMFLVVLGALLLALAGTAFAAADEEDETTAPAEVSVDVPAPAVSIAEDPPASVTPEWTFRFLVPITIVIGGLAVVGTIVAYFVKVTRQRYRVVE